MHQLSDPGGADYAKLTSLAAIWGSAFITIEYALVDFAPLSIAGLRIAIAVLTLAPVILVKRLPLPRQPRQWRLIGIIGFLYSALPFSLISWGQQFISSA